ncbi:hypothetical protein QUA41_00550 [Microcoleus sp. Pol11C1]|uniref:hypothetical protein n=1 Tax=unclassified Microcoleus TaxID=2642155 RepID=UPI002FCF6DF8
MEEGSSATDFATDVTDGRRKKEEGRRKKEEGRRKKEFFVLTNQQEKLLNFQFFFTSSLGLLRFS